MTHGLAVGGCSQRRGKLVVFFAVLCCFRTRLSDLMFWRLYHAGKNDYLPFFFF